MSDLQMPGLESLAFAWAARGWLALLAFTAAVLIVAALRKPCRRWFGAERAFQLWLLPPLAMLASQLPHAVAAPTSLPPLVYAITSAVGSPLPDGASAGSFDWRVAASMLWLAGLLAVLAFTVAAQHRYRKRLHGATPLPQASLRWPVLRATDADVGPALVGAWRSRIVLPADFAERYDIIEQTLILAHEGAHARRGDGWWSLLAHALVAPLWFHPLAWWALAALRHDQELACDAAVLREHGAQRRSYANAMLKTQSAALALPVGCTWSPRHPLTERIAMLKLSSPSRLQRKAGMFVGLLFVTVVVGSVYAASTPVQGKAAGANAAAGYQLSMHVEQGTDDGHVRHTEQMRLALCMAPGETGTARWHDPDWRIDATPKPEGDNHLRIDVAMTMGGKPVTQAQLHGVIGEPLHVEGKASDGIHDYVIDITPLAGCPARNAVAKR